MTRASASAPPPSKRPRLLVVDDEPHIGLLLRPHLESLGYDITLAKNLAEARAALGAADSGLPAGLLLDLHLPDGSGLDLLRELRAAGPTRALPVLVLTAEGEERVLQDVRRLNAQLLTKPFSPSKLAAHVDAMCGKTKGVSA